MKKRAKKAELAKIAQSEVPIALYQSKNKQIKAIAVSKGLCELYGLPAAELKQLLDQDLFAGLHPDDQPGVQADLTSGHQGLPEHLPDQAARPGRLCFVAGLGEVLRRYRLLPGLVYGNVDQPPAGPDHG